MPFVRTAELDMHYETGGEGKSVVLLLHGNFASWRWWRPVLKNMPRGYRAYAPDMRGCGDTDHPEDGYTIAQHAEDMDQFIQTLDLPRLHLVGHSLGGCIALEYALKYPKRIKTLTLVAPAPAEGRTVVKTANNGSALTSSASTMHSAFRLSESLGTIRKVFRRSLACMMSEDLVDGDFETLVDDALRMSRNAAVGHMESLNCWDVQDALGGLNLPVLIIGGQNDVLIPVKALEKAAQKLPNGRLIIWPGMGHTPQLERPARFIKILHKFTESYAAGTPKKIRKMFCRLVLSMASAREHEHFLLCD